MSSPSVVVFVAILRNHCKYSEDKLNVECVAMLVLYTILSFAKMFIRYENMLLKCMHFPNIPAK